MVHVVQPRFEAPPTTKSLTLWPPISLALKAVIVSMAFETALVMGRRRSHSGELASLSTKWFQVYEIIPSSLPAQQIHTERVVIGQAGAGLKCNTNRTAA